MASRPAHPEELDEAVDGVQVSSLWKEVCGGHVSGDVTLTALLGSDVPIPRNPSSIKRVLSLNPPINLSKLAND